MNLHLEVTTESVFEELNELQYNCIERVTSKTSRLRVSKCILIYMIILIIYCRKTQEVTPQILTLRNSQTRCLTRYYTQRTTLKPDANLNACIEHEK